VVGKWERVREERNGKRDQSSVGLANAPPMWIRLSAMTPRPTQRFTPDLTLVATAVQAVPSFQKTDAPFATSAPFLSVVV